MDRRSLFLLPYWREPSSFLHLTTIHDCTHECDIQDENEEYLPVIIGVVDRFGPQILAPQKTIKSISSTV